MQILKADTYRQISMLRQEMATDLVGAVQRVVDPAVRRELLKVIAANLRAGRVAAERAAELWPSADDAAQAIVGLEIKEGQKKKFLQQFQQFTTVHSKSQKLLEDSFRHLGVILERLGHPEEER